MHARTKLSLIAVLAALGIIVSLAPAHAQLGVTGSVQGIVKDENGNPLEGVTVTATSAAMQGASAELTDSTGLYRLTELPPGSYTLIFFYADVENTHEGVPIQLGKTTQVNSSLNTASGGGKTIIKTKVPDIDMGSTKQSTTINEAYTQNIPVPGRNYLGVLDAAPGAAGDELGTSFSGSQSLENNYIIDGVNTTGVSFGQVGSLLLNSFIQEIEIITGGYDAEFGRSTGGVVNVVTKTGSNEFHGEVFFNWEPGTLEAQRTPVSSAVDAISSEFVPDPALGYLDFGFALGGPIIKDKVWFFVGFAPIVSNNDVIRKISRRVDRETNTNNYDLNADGDGDPDTSRNVGCEVIPHPNPDPNLPPNQNSCEGDGNPDENPRTGDPIWEEVERRTIDRDRTDFNFNAKFNYAVSPDHQGSTSAIVQPIARDFIGVAGTPSATQFAVTNLITSFSSKWTSKFFNNKTQVDVALGSYSHKIDLVPLHQTTGANNPLGQPMSTLTTPQSIVAYQPNGKPMSLGRIGRNMDTRESDRVLRLCTDHDDDDVRTNRTPEDLFPDIQNCPQERAGYAYNGGGYLNDDLEARLSLRASVTERVKAAGHHTIKAGIDAEDLRTTSFRNWSGGRRMLLVSSLNPTIWQSWQFVKLQSPALGGNDDCGEGTLLPCTIYSDDPATAEIESSRQKVSSHTTNWAAFVQDSWQIMPNLTVKAGLRLEQQRLFYAKEEQGSKVYEFTDVRGGLNGRDVNAFVGAPCQASAAEEGFLCTTLGDTAMNLANLLAPRLGVLYDFTKEGRSKIYANWGRFFEAIPLSINERAFGGEVSLVSLWDGNSNSQCGPQVVSDGIVVLASDGTECPLRNDTASGAPLRNVVLGAGTLVAPGIKAQHLDEVVVGGEYEVIEDLVVGVSLQNRRLGRVIEDVSIDGANTYIIANPGEFDTGAEIDMVNEINALDGADPRREQLQGKLDDLRKLRRFPTPTREYNAVQLIAKKRFSKNFFAQGSYTYSRLTGNHPGLFSPNNGQVNPNINTQYDLLDLLANLDGKLPGDRPHNIKIDGYYVWDLKEAGVVTAGARFRAFSGVPIDTLGDHHISGYGLSSYILPRGSFGRTAFRTAADLKLAYSREIARDINVSVFIDLINLLNNQSENSVDQRYTDDNVIPIVGGTVEDLPYAKTVDDDGLETNVVASRNKNYGHTDFRYQPLYIRLGARITF